MPRKQKECEDQKRKERQCAVQSLLSGVWEIVETRDTDRQARGDMLKTGWFKGNFQVVFFEGLRCFSNSCRSFAG